MKTLLLAAMMAAVAIATAMPPAQAQTTDDTEAEAIARALRATNGTARPYTKSNYRTRRAVRTPRTAAQARTWAVSRNAGSKKLQLPEYKPYYTGTGAYIPTTYIYQQTNGEFKILRPTASAAPTTGQPGGVNAALRNINRGPGNAAAPAAPAAARPQPPAPPSVPQGNVSNSVFRPGGSDGGVRNDTSAILDNRAADNANTTAPRSNFP